MAGPAHRLALRQRQGLRQRCAGGDEPAAEIGARRAGARVLDDRAVLGKEESAQHLAGPVARPRRTPSTRVPPPGSATLP